MPIVEITFTLLLIVQALHLLHHRLAKRHISFFEVVSAGVLCIPLTAVPSALLASIHVVLALVQLIGSTKIERFSPNWPA